MERSRGRAVTYIASGSRKTAGTLDSGRESHVMTDVMTDLRDVRDHLN